MSDMQLQIAIRFEIGNFENKNEAFKKAKEIMQREPDEVDEWDGNVDYFCYEITKDNKFTINFPEKTLFLDYMINEERDSYGIDENITLEDIQKVQDKVKSMGVEYKSCKLKVLYFYNGGCAGISEVI